MWKNWLIYLMSIAGCVLFTILYHKHSAFVVLIAVIVVPVLSSFLTCVLAKKNVNVSLGMDETSWEKGKKGEFRVVLESLSELHEGNPVVITIAVYNGMGQRIQRIRKRGGLTLGKQQISFGFVPDYSGIHEIVLEKVKVFGSFSLFCMTKHPREKIRFLIMPEYREFPVCISGQTDEKEGNSDRYSVSKSGNDPSEIFRIRAYRPGDKMNQIHWKYSAKQGELMVQDYGMSIACDFAVFFEVSGQIEPKLLEKAMEMLYYVMVHLVTEKRLFYVIWKNAGENCVCRKMIDREEAIYELFEELFRTNIHHSESRIEDLYHVEYEGEILGDTLFLCAGRKDLEYEELRSRIRTERLEMIQVEK